MRPAKPFHPAREAILSMIKNNIQYTYEKFVDLVEYNIFRNNHIAYDVRPSTWSVLPYVPLGQKSLETPGLE